MQEQTPKEQLPEKQNVDNGNIWDMMETLEKDIAELHNKSNTKEDHAYVLYSDGRITSQKGGELMWARSEFTDYAPLLKKKQSKYKKMKLPENYGIKPKKTIAYLKEKDAIHFRERMKKIYGFTKELDYSEQALGFTVQEKEEDTIEESVKELNKKYAIVENE